MAKNEHMGFREEAAAFRRSGATREEETREVQASVAKAHFSQLLDEVERGTTIVVLRHGRPVARLVPEEDGRQQRAAKAAESIKKLARERAKRFGPVTIEEIVSSIHEGHRF